METIDENWRRTNFNLVSFFVCVMAQNGRALGIAFSCVFQVQLVHADIAGGESSVERQLFILAL